MFNELDYIEYLLKNFKEWASQYENKNNEDGFEMIYYFTYEAIKKSEINSIKKIDCFNKLKDIRRIVF